MIKFQGRSTLKQYLPMKPVKRGIKVWVAASSNRYFWNMQVRNKLNITNALLHTGVHRQTDGAEKRLDARVVK